MQHTEGKIFFVGMHNKAGMTPLDSRTMSGKLIDRVISELSQQCVKTNLCDVEHLLINEEDLFNANIKWDFTHRPKDNDIIILLGKWVQKNFLITTHHVFNIPHPASVRSNTAKEEYIKNIINKIIYAAHS